MHFDWFVFTEEKPEEEGQSNDGLESGSIIGIIIACLVTALVVLIIIIISVIAMLHDRKKEKHEVNLETTNPDVYNR